MKNLLIKIIQGKVWIFLSFMFIVLGFISGVVFSNTNNTISEILNPKILRQSGEINHFTNPILDCDSYSQKEIIKLKPLEAEIKSVIDQGLAEGKIHDISVYYRDLNNGPWIGINIDESFSPASLLKVPLMIAYFKLADTDPTILQKKLTINTSEISPLNQSILPTNIAENGKTYTVDKLIQLMIKNSDNNAKHALDNAIDKRLADEVYIDLGLKIPGSGSAEDTMNIKDYVTFFRVLYNATYLDRDMSEKALEYLSKSEYKNGLSTKIPENIIIAHKFGERTIKNGDSRKNILQLHDCGIVYAPESPYIICVMTRGKDFEKMSQVIADISKVIFDFIQRIHNR